MQLEPTPQAVVSALLNSIYNAEDEEQMSAAVNAFCVALNAIAEYDVSAAEVFVSQLYVTLMENEYTRLNIEKVGYGPVNIG